MTTPMSDAPEHDRALDYLYGLLDGDEKARFETHLVGCGRCQAELEANGRVRAVAKTVLPAIEPSARLSGALHVQLMHEAARREPRGKMLPFVRRIVRHPGYAAAAGLLLIGGAVGVQWSRGRLTMPPAEEAKVASPSPVAPSAAATVAKNAPVSTTPVAEPKPEPEPAAKLDKNVVDSKVVAVAQAVSTPAPSKAKASAPSRSEDEMRKEVSSSSRLESNDLLREKDRPSRDLDDSLSGANGVGSSKGDSSLDGELARKPTAHAAAPKSEVANAEKAEEDSSPYDREPRVGDASKKRARADDGASPPPPGTRSAESNGPTQQRQYAQNQPAYKSAYGDDARNNVSQNKASENNASRNNASRGNASQNGGGGYAAPSAPLAQNAMPSAAPDEAPAVAPSLRNADPVEIQRSRAGRYAQDEHCADAVRVYGDLERRAPGRLSSQDRLTYARCLRVLGRVEPAQTELDQVAGQVPQPAYAAEQQALDVERRRQSAPRAVKPSKRAADAASDSNSDVNATKR